MITWDAAALGGGVLSPAATIDVTYQAGVPMRQNTTTFTGATPSAASLGQGRNLDNNSGPSTFEDGFTDNGADAIISVAEPTATSTVTMNGTYTGTTAGALQPVVETFGIEIEDIVISKSSTGSLFHGATVVSTLTVSTGEYRDFQDLSSPPIGRRASDPAQSSSTLAASSTARAATDGTRRPSAPSERRICSSTCRW